VLQDGQGRDKQLFKKVAVVENFFDIIYSVHVEMEGRAGKHAGQKRTYRTVSLPLRIDQCLVSGMQSVSVTSEYTALKGRSVGLLQHQV
jgi:hypothetical protein